MTIERTSLLRDLLERGVEQFRDRHFLKYKTQGRVENETFEQFYESVKKWAAFLREHGVKEGHRVALISEKSSAQVRLMYATWLLGAIAVPVCEVFGHKEMEFVLKDCDPKLIIVQDKLMEKFSPNFGKIAHFSFYDLIAHTENHSDTVEIAPLKKCAVDDVAALIYTSGSTGMPKGVMLTHRNLSANALSATKSVEISNEDVCFSILPYWHSFAMTLEVITPMLAGFCVAFANDRRDFLKSMEIYNPSVILGVPRVFETMRSGILKQISKESSTVQKLFHNALKNAISTNGKSNKEAGKGGLIRRLLNRGADKLFFEKIRSKFGNRLKFFISGGAPLDMEYQHFFKALGIPVYQGYGLTESSPIISVNDAENYKFGSCGQIFDWLKPENGGDYTFLADDGTRSKDVEGELLVKGDCVMKGYWHHADASAKTLDNGWLHTGDVAYVDEDGFLFISGRKGNMIVLVGGEKLHPEHVEDALKNSTYISEAMVIGDSLKNVYACVNVPEELKTTHTEEELHLILKKEAQKHCAHLAVYQRPKAVLCVPDFNVEDGTLTATMKVRRYKIQERDGELIDKFLKTCGELV